MRAIAIHDYGRQPTLTDLPTPEPGPGEVLVRVQASSLNGFDVAVAGGYLKGMMEHRFPVVLGKDFAGTVEALGEGAARFRIGDAVYGVVMKQFLGDGAFGDYVVVGEQFGITAVPDGLDLATAGVLGLAGSAALGSVDAVAPQHGDTLLISGATGGVGALTIQYAVAAGATVLATARPGAEAEFVAGLGAHHAIDHTGDLAAQVRVHAPEGVSGIVHLAGDGAALTELLAAGGRLASTLGLGLDQHPAATAVMASPDQGSLDRLAADVAAGRLRVPTSRAYDLADVPKALADFSAGTLGKLAVNVA
jgi:NADPH:quinone reductase-like Zn-dependent oxidoreductase